MRKKMLQPQKGVACLTLAACLLVGCHKTSPAPQDTWSATLPNTGISATLDCNGLDENIGVYVDENGVANEYVLLSTEVSPVLTLQGVQTSQVSLFFAAPPAEPGGSYAPDNIAVVPFDYTITENENSVSYQLDTLYSYIIRVEKDGKNDCILIQIRGREAYL